MIGIVDVSIQTHNVSMPLYPMRAFEGSPSSIRVRSVPKKIGNWQINKVYFAVAYPDNTTQTIECKLVGGVYVGTIAGCNTVGNVQNGYSIYADGVDENGNAVTNYCLGKGDIQILDARGITQPLQNTTFVQILTERPDAPNDGDMWQEDGAWYVWQNNQAWAIGDESGLIQQLTERVDGVETALSSKADVSATVLNPIYGGNGQMFSEWSFNDGQSYTVTGPFEHTYGGGFSDWYYILDDKDGSETFSTEADALSATRVEFYRIAGDNITATRTENPVVGYTLGDQTTKSLQPTGDYALSSDLSSKQDKLTDPQISAIDSVVDDRATKVKYQDNTTSSFNIVGELSASDIPNIENIASIKVGTSVTSIANDTFYSLYLSSVTIGSGVTSIGNHAFQACNIKNITIPGNVTSIGTDAFRNCSQLTNVVIEEGVTSIGAYAFRGSSAVKVTIPKSVMNIDVHAFEDCLFMESITFVGRTISEVQNLSNFPWDAYSGIITTYNPASKEWVNTQLSTAIEQQLSTKQDKLTTAQISAINQVVDERATIIDFGNGDISAFNWSGTIDMNNLLTADLWNGTSGGWNKQPIDVKIGTMVSCVGYSMFDNCSELTSVTMPDSIKVIDQRAFRNCPKLQKADLPNSVSSIGNNAFSMCSALIDVTIPKGLKVVGTNTFLQTGISSVTIEDGFTDIGGGMFAQTPNLTHIEIPSSVSAIGTNAFYFYQTQALTSVVFKDKTFGQVSAMANYPWGISDPGNVITTYTPASQEWVKEYIAQYLQEHNT